MITYEELIEHVAYNPTTGVFTWVKVTNHKTRLGEIAGHLTKTGYRYIGIKKRPYSASRLAWLYVYGVWPKVIDHINRKRDDDRIINLREVTYAQNSYNRPPRPNQTGFTGVYCRGKKYVAAAKIAYKLYHLGSFNTAEEASEAYISFTASVKEGYKPTTTHLYATNPYPTILRRQQLKKDLEDLI